MFSISLFAIVLSFSDSKFSEIPGANVGILGISEMSCNPTCLPPIYHDINRSIRPDCRWKDEMIESIK